MKGIEKRQNQRFSFRDTLEFTFSATHSAKDAPRQKARGIDISSGGVCLEARDALLKGEILKLFIPFQKSDANIPVLAEVLWVSSSNENLRAGLHFLS